MKFSDFFAQHEYGLADEKAAELLRELFASCGTEQRAGTLTLKISVKPEHDAFAVTVDIASKAPQPEAKARLYWTDFDGNPSLRNPIQPSFDDHINEQQQ